MTTQTIDTNEELSFCSEQAPHSLKYNTSGMSLGVGHTLEAIVIGIDNLDIANQFVDSFDKPSCVYIGNTPTKNVSKILFEVKSGVTTINLIQKGNSRRIWYDPQIQDCMVTKSADYGQYGQTYKIDIKLKENA